MNVLLLVALVVTAPSPQEAVREARAPASGAVGAIRGRITERDTGVPLPRFRVSVSLELLQSEGTRAIETVLTDADGSYYFPAIRPGRYLITARPPEYVSTHLPQIYGEGSSMGATRVQLTAGRALDVNIALQRSLAIEGRVMTAEGDPLAGVLVSIEGIGLRAQRPAIVTDDRGYYRHYGLPPGRYRICAAPAAAPDASTESASHEAGLKTCAEANAAGAALEITTADFLHADILIGRARGFVVSGAVFDSSGAALDRGEVSFVEQRGRSRRLLKVQRATGGRFLIGDVAPGRYVIRVEVQPQHPGDTRPREFGEHEVVVSRNDIGDVVVRTRRPALVSGTVTFEGDAPATGIDRMAVTVRKEVADYTLVSDVFTSRTVRENLTFDMGAAVEPVRIGLDHVPSEWVVRSILYRGRDVTDEAVVLEASDDQRAVEIILTNRVAYITGRALGPRPGPELIVLAVRMDKATPGSPGSDGAPVARAAMVDDRGAFKLGPLEPGDYYVAAVERDQWFDVSVQNRAGGIARLIAHADRVSVIEGQQPGIAIRVVSVK